MDVIKTYIPKRYRSKKLVNSSSGSGSTTVINSGSSDFSPSAFVDSDTFYSMFEYDAINDAIKAKKEFYSVSGITAYGTGTVGGGGGTGVAVYNGLDSTDISLALSAAMGKQLNDTKLNTSAISEWAKASTKPSYTASEIGGLGASYRWLTDTYISTWNAKEPAIVKLTAFNKNFGTTAGTVSEGNHTHDDRYKMWYRDQGIDVDANRKENTYLSAYRWINTPVGGIGILETNNQYSNDWVTQEFTLIGSQSRKFIRSFYGGTTWGDWFEFWHSGNLTSLSQLTDNIGVASHIANKTNPHSVTKAQVGLGNVDNTSDANKPISTAVQNALNLKLNKSIFDDLFEKVEVSTGVYAIKAKYNFYSVGEVSAYGAGSGTGGGGGSMVVWGSESGGGVPLIVEGISKTLSLASHSHNYLSAETDPTVPAWAKAATKPTYNASEIGGLGVSYRWLTDAYITTWNAKEPAITKLTAFNKNFGITAGTVAEGNHVHTFASLTNTPTTLAGYGITTGLTTNYLTKWNGTTIVNSSIFDNGTYVGIGTIAPSAFLHLYSGAASDFIKIQFNTGGGGNWAINPFILGVSNGGLSIVDKLFSVTPFVIQAKTNNVGIGTTSPAYKLDVNGTGRFASDLTAQTDIILNTLASTDKSVKNFINKFNAMFDTDVNGNIVAKTNLYSVGGISAYQSGAGVSGLTLQGDMNANGKAIYSVNYLQAGLSVQGGSAIIGSDPLGLFGTGMNVGLYNADNDTVIAAYDDFNGMFYYANSSVIFNNNTNALQSPAFKFGSWTFRQDASGRLGIYNGATEVACFNTDGTYVNL